MDSYEDFRRLFEGEMSQDEGRDFLVSLYERGEDVEDIVSATKVMREHSIKIDIGEFKESSIDIVGTGGDKSGSYNISTTASLLLASANRPIAKHGNRSITSKSGSADLLEVLGINLDIDIEKLPKMLEECGFIFMFAQKHHPAMKHVMPLRKSLTHRTIFNILGPLTNPASVKKQLIGVFSSEFSKKMSEAMQILGSEDIMVVASRDGLDEISISDITYFSHLKEGKIIEGEIDPQEYGMKLVDIEEIKGGDAKENAKITRGLLSGEIDGAKLDILLLNAAASFMVEGSARDIQDGIEIAREEIASKKAIKKIEEIAKVSHSL